jgi:hypothetical protein
VLFCFMSGIHYNCLEQFNCDILILKAMLSIETNKEVFNPQAEKSINSESSILLEILPNGANVKWCFTPTSYRNTNEANEVEIEYDYREEDEDLEPRAFFRVGSDKYYIDEFTLLR